MVSFIRQYYPGELNKNDHAQHFTKDRLIPLIEFYENRFKNQPIESAFFKDELNRLADEWVQAIKHTDLKRYDELLLRPAEKNGEDEDWVIMQSMREVDTNSYVSIKGYR